MSYNTLDTSREPPYNTGNKSWIYNDRYVDAQDQSKSSKWLSFMERRLRAAKPLLRETGVIIVAIGDDEHHRLRMLMDQIFGADNFISDVVWQGGRKNDSRYVSNGADYMLVYAQDSDALADSEVRWRERRAGTDEILEAADRAWSEAQGATPADRASVAELALKKWQRSQPTDHPARSKGLADYNKIDENGEVYRKKDISWPGGGGPRFDVLHPVTGKPVRVPGRGWVYSTPERMQEEIDAGRVIFGPDHTHFINRKSLLREADTMGPESVFVHKRTGASVKLAGIFGDRRFPFPKDHQVLARWINLAAPRDAVVLDFFGGSGSTMEAVLRLNAEDGGTRQCILVTNNELAHKDATALRKAGHHPGDDQFEAKGVFRHVAHPRIKTVATGVREDGSVYDETGLPANVAFYSLTQLDPGRVRRGREFTAIAPILWMQAGGVGPVIDREANDFTLTDTYGVLFDTGHRRAFTQAVNERQPRTAFIVTDSSATFRDVAAGLPGSVQSVQLYESYLSNFEVNTTRLEA